MTRRVIFLDVDGVLNHADAFGRWKSLFGSDVLDPECVARLVALAKATGGEVVLSSTWRLIDDARVLIRAVLWTHGVLVLECTPDLFSLNGGNNTSTRADEIRAWLSRNPDVERFAILDDDPSASIDGHTVLTDFDAGGLTDAHVDAARRILA